MSAPERGAYPPFRPDARVLACPACGYGCGCCCSCACQTACPAPDPDGDCDCEYPACHGGHEPLSCHDWGTRRAAYKAASSESCADKATPVCGHCADCVPSVGGSNV